MTDDKHIRELVMVDDGHVTSCTLPDAGQVTMGRGPDNHIVVEDGAISRNHVVIRAQREVEIIDLGSANGTFVDGERIAAHTPTRLGPGCSFEAGGAMFKLQVHTRAPPLEPPAPHEFFSHEVADAVSEEDSVAVIRVRVDGQAPAEVLRGCLTRYESEVVSMCAPGVYDLLLCSITEGIARARATELVNDLESNGLSACAGVAHSQRGERTAHELLAGAALDALGLHPLTPAPDEVVFDDPNSALLVRFAERISPGVEPLVLAGEPSVGRGVFARMIHRLVFDEAAPFVRLSSRTATAKTAEAALTEAAGGVLYVANVEAMAREARWIIERAVDDEDNDVQVIAGTTGTEGRWFDAARLTIPPLRQRRDDIPGIAQFFLRRLVEAQRLPPNTAFSKAALNRLQRHDWPGNNAELFSVVSRAASISAGGRITTEFLPLQSLEQRWTTLRHGSSNTAPDDRAERDRIVEALERCEGNQTRAAALIGISRSALRTRVKRYGITPHKE